MNWYVWFQYDFESYSAETYLVDHVRSEFVIVLSDNEDNAYELLKAHIPVDSDNKKYKNYPWSDEPTFTFDNLFEALGICFREINYPQVTLIFSKDSHLILRKRLQLT